MIFDRRRRSERLEERLSAYWRTRSEPSFDAAYERLGALLAQLDVGWYPADEARAGFFLDSTPGRIACGLDPDGEQVSFLDFIGPLPPEERRAEAWFELLRANETTGPAHYGLADITSGRSALLRAIVPVVGLELGPLAAALEALLRQSHRTLGAEEAPPTEEHPLAAALAAHRRRYDEQGRTEALREGAQAVEHALGELSLDWHAEPDRAHDWRVETDLGTLQAYLMHYGEALVVRLALDEVDDATSVETYDYFLQLSASGGAWCSLTEDELAGRWIFATAVVSAETLRPAVLANLCEGVLRHGRVWSDG